MRFAISLGATTALVGACALLQCRQPTEITVDVTNEACGALGVVAGPPSGPAAGTVAEATTCAGSVVVVPSGDQGARVGIRAVAALAGTDVATCLAGGTPDKCIVARRVVSFLPHDGPHLPIALRLDCAGVACPDDQTCVHHACVSSAPTGGCLDLEGCIDAGPPTTPPPPQPPTPPIDGGQPDTGPIEAGTVPEVIVSGETNLTAIDVRGAEIVWATRNPDSARKRLIAKGSAPTDMPLTVKPVVVRLDATGTVWVGGDEAALPGLQRITTTASSSFFGAIHPTGLALGNGGAWYVDANRQKLGFFSASANTPIEGPAGSPFDVASNGALTCWTTDASPSAQGILWTNDAAQPGMKGITTLGTPEAVAMNSGSCVWNDSGSHKMMILDVGAGGPALPIADVTDGVTSVDVTDTAAYWLNVVDGNVYKLALGTSGAKPVVLVNVDETGHGRLRQALAHDATFLYVISFKAGQIVRVPL